MFLLFFKNKKSGSALVYALIIMSATLIILTSMIGYTSSQIKFSSNRAEKEKALQIAESGIFWYRWYLAHEVSGKTPQQISDFWQGGTALGIFSPYEQNFSDPEGGVIGKFSINVEVPSAYSTIVIVKSTGWTDKEPDLKRTVQVRFRRPSWSEFSVLSNSAMRFGAGTNIYGKIHSNKGIRFDGFTHNIISSSVANYDDPDHTGGVEFGVHTHLDSPPAVGSLMDSFRPHEAPPKEVPERTDVFEAGREFPVPEVSFSGVVADFSFMKTQAQDPAKGLYFNDDNLGRHIILKTNGTMEVRNVLDYDTASNGIKSESSSTNYNIPDEGVIFVENNVWVEGAIDGKRISIVAARLSGGTLANIFIGMNNLRYGHSDGTDVIGLIAQNNVEVVRESLDFLTIDAALLAQAGRVGREHYDTWCSVWHFVQSKLKCDEWTTDHRDTITINGAIASNLRFGFAYSDGTGYANRNLNFDNNMIYFPPPYFPTGTNYFIDLWEEL